MDETQLRLDGNAAAGVLRNLFVDDLTTARGAWCFTTTRIVPWLLTISTAAATSSGTAIKFTSTATTVTATGSCFSTPASAARSTSNISACIGVAAASFEPHMNKQGRASLLCPVRFPHLGTVFVRFQLGLAIRRPDYFTGPS